MKSFGEVLASHQGLGPGFNFLRLGLALTIVFYHVLCADGYYAVAHGPVLWFFEYSLVPMFFALSGFLITASAQRLDLANFLLNRSLRIVPALAVDILICALIIGPAVTTLSPGEYFTNTGFLAYFMNTIGLVHLQLPGVFTRNPIPEVNGALWTIPWEINCYIVMAFMMITGAVQRAAATLLLLAGFFIAGLVIEHLIPVRPGEITGLHTLFVTRGAKLITAFLCGVLAYQLRDRIPMRRGLFYICIAIVLDSALLLDVTAGGSVANRLILIPALTYITVYAGLSRLPLPKILERGDYSYGVYLYHVPFIQLSIFLAPSVFVGTIPGVVMLTAVTVTVVLCVAALSWHFIEKPVLSLRRFALTGRVIAAE
ncbi:peptidoglycan/LPS O-acetylase OafA/YrhL [Rhizobium sp. BK650]|uniref:acyltransferase family protein n=1 Tax=Rhizobium sp. BK650 TaxID=2586990 RepID=UPI00161C2B5E|nr:acyltransferase [Rhizobium sp. BK650]MBB3656621.1 peptidoglycan/LPS O-acetylase OafA/YrhL [Rhizobium sp. BK650]